MVNMSFEELRDSYVKELEELDEKIIRYRCRLNNLLTQRVKNSEKILVCRKILIVLENERDEMNLSIREMNKYLED